MQQQPPGASEIRYRRLFETAQDGILILDGHTGVIIDANPFLTGSLGYRREELLGKPLWQIDAIVDPEAVKQAFAEMEHRDHVRHEHLRLRRKDGSLLDAECVSDAYEVEGQRVHQCNVLDLTDRRRLVRRTRDDEARFRALIENAADAVVVSRLDGTISYVSPAIETLAGYQPAELIGRRYFELLHPDDVAAAADLLTPSWRITPAPPGAGSCGFATRTATTGPSPAPRASCRTPRASTASSPTFTMSPRTGRPRRPCAPRSS